MNPDVETIEISEPLNSVLDSYWDNYGPGCRGLDKYEVRPEFIREWLEFNSQADLDVAQRQIEEIIEYLAIEERNVYIPALTDGGSSAIFVDLLMEWRVAIEQAPTTALPPVQRPETVADRFRGRIAECLTLVGWAALLSTPIVILIALFYWLLGWL